MTFMATTPKLLGLSKFFAFSQNVLSIHKFYGVWKAWYSMQI